MQNERLATQGGGTVEHIDSAGFRSAVLEADMPVLVDFYADWCPPCRRLAPVLEELAQETPEARIVKVNVDENPDLASRYRVSSIPTLIVFRDGKPAGQSVGAAPKETLRKMLSK